MSPSPLRPRDKEALGLIEASNRRGAVLSVRDLGSQLGLPWNHQAARIVERLIEGGFVVRSGSSAKGARSPGLVAVKQRFRLSQ